MCMCVCCFQIHCCRYCLSLRYKMKANITCARTHKLNRAHTHTTKIVSRYKAIEERETKIGKPIPIAIWIGPSYHNSRWILVTIWVCTFACVCVVSFRFSWISRVCRQGFLPRLSGWLAGWLLGWLPFMCVVAILFGRFSFICASLRWVLLSLLVYIILQRDGMYSISIGSPCSRHWAQLSGWAWAIVLAHTQAHRHTHINYKIERVKECWYCQNAVYLKKKVQIFVR